MVTYCSGMLSVVVRLSEGPEGLISLFADQLLNRLSSLPRQSDLSNTPREDTTNTTFQRRNPISSNLATHDRSRSTRSRPAKKVKSDCSGSVSVHVNPVSAKKLRLRMHL
ncbi:hypothetical protein V8C44DRAFT_317783 [Trichoderma aethiopicum]